MRKLTVEEYKACVLNVLEKSIMFVVKTDIHI